jgi:hypothetical protein
MKKLVLICSAVVVLIAFALPVFAMEMYAPEVRNAKLEEEEINPGGFSGEFTFGTSTDFDAANGTAAFANMYVDGHVYPGMYNSVFFRMTGAGTFSAASQLLWFQVTYFSLTTDVGAFFDLPIGLENTAGMDSLYSREFEVTGHTWESTQIETGIDPLAWKFAIDAGMVTVDIGLGFGEGDEALNDIGFVVTVPEVGPASLEAFYLAQDNADYKGVLGIDAQATDLMDMIGVAAGFAYDTVAEIWKYGIGASVAYMGATVGAGIRGMDGATLDDIWVDADYSFGDFGVTAAFALSESQAGGDGIEFLGVDLSAYVSVEDATWRVGYVITDWAYTYGGAAMGPEGGLYVVCDIDF